MSNAGEFAKRALCQDCLRAHALADLKCDAGDPPGRCRACGGQACDCHFCMTTLAALERGDRGKVVGIKQPIGAWSATEGAQ